MPMSKLAEKVIKSAIDNGYIILSAESCTAGMIGAALTDISGASKAYHGGFVVYDNMTKNQFINVSQYILDNHGAVSAECAKAMAQGTLERYNPANISIAVTGIAGPNGGSAEKPVGLVYFGCTNKRLKRTIVDKKVFKGNREHIRQQTVEHALELILKQILGT
ncbi:MAG: CinA family protein [Alphaproteobacteria bacterium]|nr:CinA family protein [Alphaproteobacteria bacterium]